MRVLAPIKWILSPLKWFVYGGFAVINVLGALAGIWFAVSMIIGIIASVQNDATILDGIKAGWYLFLHWNVNDYQVDWK